MFSKTIVHHRPWDTKNPCQTNLGTPGSGRGWVRSTLLVENRKKANASNADVDVMNRNDSQARFRNYKPNITIVH